MKLYLYDHCPFCMRAQMVANYKNVSLEKVYLLNDDETTCYRLIDTKQVPILQFDDGRAMGESIKIAHVLDGLGDPTKPIRPHGDWQAIGEHIEQVRTSIDCLLLPRTIALGLPEFATRTARDYFQDRKEQIIRRPFIQAVAETPQHKARVEGMLATLPPLEAPGAHGNSLGWDDVLLYPTLRSLSMVRNLAFPPQVRAYIEEVARLTATTTYFDRAV